LSVTLSKAAYEHAQRLIGDGEKVADERDAWSEHQPSAAQENRFIDEHGFGEYARWHLGVDDTKPKDTKGRYKFPYGDLQAVHRCAVLSAESRAGQYDYRDVELAAAHLHGMLDAPAART
jgi:hypothetical protein